MIDLKLDKLEPGINSSIKMSETTVADAMVREMGES